MSKMKVWPIMFSLSLLVVLNGCVEKTPSIPLPEKTAPIHSPNKSPQTKQNQPSRSIEYWIEKAAVLGDAEAQYTMGKMLLDSDQEKSIVWLTKAADQGMKEAKNILEERKRLAAIQNKKDILEERKRLAAIQNKKDILEERKRLAAIQNLLTDKNLKNGKINGRGVLMIDGGKYEGEFKDNKFHGHGVLTLSIGIILEGEFHNGVFVGK